MKVSLNIFFNSRTKQVNFDFETDPTLKELTEKVQSFLEYHQPVKFLFAGRILSDENLINAINETNRWEEEIQCYVMKPQSALPSSLPSRSLSLLEVLDNCAKKTPEKIAVTYRGGSISYQNLYDSVNKISLYLQKNLQVKPGSVIGIMGSDKQKMIIVELAVLKLGACFVPLDAQMPKDRLHTILQDSNASFVINCETQIELSGACTIVLFCDIEKESNEISKQMPTETFDDSLPAYILYTSGSSGIPKGVVQSRRGILGQIKNYTNDLSLTSNDHFLQLATLSHDQAIVDVFGALLNGSTLHFYDLHSGNINPEEIRNLIRSKEITIFSSIPSLFSLIFHSASPEESFPSLRIITIGGEETDSSHLRLFQKTAPDHCLLINGYGATECSWIASATFRKTDSIDAYREIPLGEISGEIEVEIDHSGELLIHTPYMCQGYHRNVSQESFIVIDGKKYYRTGDLVAREWRENKLVYLFKGRKAWHQKINGKRINIKSVENTILPSFPQIEKVVILSRKANISETQDIRPFNRPYVLYTCHGETTGKLSELELRTELKEKLSQAEIPFRFIQIDEFPLLPNGKLDRKKTEEILSLLLEKESSSKEESMPAHPIEASIARILELKDAVSEDRSLLDYGATSIDLFRIRNEIQKLYSKYSLKITLPQIYQFKTIRDLKEEVERQIAHHPGEQGRAQYSQKPEIIRSAFMVGSEAGETFATVEMELFTPNFPAQQMIAKHYSEKYDIQIKICESIPDFIQTVERFLQSDSKKPLGLSFPKLSQKEAHTVPCILYKKEGKGVLYVADSLGIPLAFDESQSYPPQQKGAKILFEKLNRLVDIKFDPTSKHLDGESCTIQTLVYLKDALRIEESSFIAFSEDEAKKIHEEVLPGVYPLDTVFFYSPLQLYKLMPTDSLREVFSNQQLEALFTTPLSKKSQEESHSSRSNRYKGRYLFKNLIRQNSISHREIFDFSIKKGRKFKQIIERKKSQTF